MKGLTESQAHALARSGSAVRCADWRYWLIFRQFQTVVWIPGNATAPGVERVAETSDFSLAEFLATDWTDEPWTLPAVDGGGPGPVPPGSKPPTTSSSVPSAGQSSPPASGGGFAGNPSGGGSSGGGGGGGGGGGLTPGGFYPGSSIGSVSVRIMPELTLYMSPSGGSFRGPPPDGCFLREVGVTPPPITVSVTGIVKNDPDERFSGAPPNGTYLAVWNGTNWSTSFSAGTFTSPDFGGSVDPVTWELTVANGGAATFVVTLSSGVAGGGGFYSAGGGSLGTFIPNSYSSDTYYFGGGDVVLTKSGSGEERAWKANIYVECDVQGMPAHGSGSVGALSVRIAGVLAEPPLNVGNGNGYGFQFSAQPFSPGGTITVEASLRVAGRLAPPASDSITFLPFCD